MPNFFRFLAILLIVILIINLILLGLRKISATLFWTVIIFAAVISFVLPKIKKRV